MCKVSEEQKNKFIDIVLKAIEYKYLKNHFNKIIFLTGVGLISRPIFIDILYQTLGIKDSILEYIIFFIGVLLILFSLAIFIIDHKSNNATNQEIINQKSQNNISSIIRTDILIASRCKIILLLISLILILIGIFILLLRTLGFTPLAWFFLVILVLVIQLIAIVALQIFHIKNNKLLTLYKNKCIEYGQDGNIYLTEYDIKCPVCNNISYIEWNEAHGYHLQCKEYPNDIQHKKTVVISDFNKFSNP